MKVIFLTAIQVLLFVCGMGTSCFEAKAQKKDYIYLIGEKVVKGSLLELTPKKIKYQQEDLSYSPKKTLHPTLLRSLLVLSNFQKQIFWLRWKEK
jgi:hypothetical protein